jgi:hypothetical protein
MKHDTSSAVAEAALWMKGWGIKGDDEPLRVGLAFVSRDFTASYVVKKAPAFGKSDPKEIE